LARIRRDPQAAEGWCYASLCQAIPVATKLRNLTHDADKVSCPQCRRWIHKARHRDAPN